MLEITGSRERPPAWRMRGDAALRGVQIVSGGAPACAIAGRLARPVLSHPSPGLPVRRLALAFAGVLACSKGQVPESEGPSASLAGDWVGGHRIGKRYTLFALHLPTKGPASFDLPGDGVVAAPLKGYLATGDGLRFTLPGARVPVALQGHVEGEALVGVARSEGEDGSFELRRTVPLAPEAARAYAGLYDAGGGHLIAIERLPDVPLLHFTDFASGRFGAIFPEAEDRFFAGPALLVAAPPVLRLAFRREQSAITSVTFQQDGEPDTVAVRLPTRETPLKFNNGEVALAGTLISPGTPGPHPAVVLTQTSSDAPREAYRKDADFFVSQGFAALIYDKRGVGESGGDWRLATFPDLAGDAVAAVELLRARPDIDPLRVGVWGQSQGGWVATLAATRSPNVAFTISISTPSTSPAEQEIFRVEHNLRADGFPEGQILEAVHYQRLLMEWIREGTRRAELLEALAAAEKAPWAGYVALPATPLPVRARDSTREFYTYDPAPTLAALRCPALFVFGAADSFVPVVRSVPEIKAALAKGHPHSLIKVLPHTGHGMWETDVDSRHALPLAHRHGPGYWPLLGEWLAGLRAAR